MLYNKSVLSVHTKILRFFIAVFTLLRFRGGRRDPFDHLLTEPAAAAGSRKSGPATAGGSRKSGPATAGDSSKTAGRPRSTGTATTGRKSGPESATAQRNNQQRPALKKRSSNLPPPGLDNIFEDDE
jgi:hypothetical protein